MNISLNPVAFSIGTFSIRWYGIFMMLAILAIVWWSVRAVGKQKIISADSVITAAIIAIPSGIVVSRFLHVVDEWAYYKNNPGQILGTDGLTIYGGMIGAILAIWVYSKVAKFHFGYLMDLIVPGIPIAQAIGRMGSLVNGCCYGLETSVPWAITYTNPSSFAPLFTPVHPTQIYEILFLLLSLGIVLKLRGRIKPYGSLLIVYIGLYSAWRFGIGFLRAGTMFMFGLQQAQVIALALLAVAVSVLAYRARWVKATEIVTEMTKAGEAGQDIPNDSSPDKEGLKD